ncbi:hypothetical protein MUK42_12290 [Musa troglodytarum]|uniref:Uncharacterized protein n=1 Tax=Musa troglodytarum TaxID=320322 RepID=A0A9E7GPW1_9LILI|nr:hypothetical protein MUK42_12290 [Musa troglodytarum]
MEFETAENDGHLRESSSRKKRKRKESKTWMTTEEKKPTVSIAVAGSIIDNAQSLELATLVVVFDNRASSDVDTMVRTGHDGDESESGAEFLTMILRYLETPQYLRRRLFPMHKSLKFVGLLPPLDAPHHLRKHEWCSFREGVTLDVNPPNSKGTLVDVGLNKNVVIEEVLEPGKRITVAMGDNRGAEIDGFKKAVDSSSPRDQIGMYWGYKVRYCSNLSSVIRNCPYKGGYDHIIGTSEHGLVVSSSELKIPSFRHLLIVFGGLGGLEENIEEDNSLKVKDHIEKALIAEVEESDIYLMNSFISLE